MKTIKYYTLNKKYMGWQKVKTLKEQALTLRSWLLSGNYIISNGLVITKINMIKTIY